MIKNKFKKIILGALVLVGVLSTAWSVNAENVWTDPTGDFTLYCSVNVSQVDGASTANISWNAHVGARTQDYDYVYAEVYLASPGRSVLLGGEHADGETGGTSYQGDLPEGDYTAIVYSNSSQAGIQPGSCSESVSFHIDATPPPQDPRTIPVPPEVPSDSCSINSFTVDDDSFQSGGSSTLRLSLNGNYSWSIYELGNQEYLLNSGTGSSGEVSTGVQTQGRTFRAYCGNDVQDVSVYPVVPPPPAEIVDGGWSGWGVCSVTACGQTGTQERTCDNPSPQNGGAPCVGEPSQSCSTAICEPDMTGNIQATPSCEIPVGADHCNITVSWSVDHPESGTEVTTPSGLVLSSAHSGTLTWGLTRETRNFYLYNNNEELDVASATADCGQGSPWVNGVCGPVPPDPVAGICSSSHYDCTAGDSDNHVFNSSQYAWSCTGINGGATASCSEAIVNGDCSATRYACDAGTSASNAESSTQYTWSCNSTNGGLNASCSEPKDLAACGIYHYSCNNGVSGGNSEDSTHYAWSCTAADTVNCTENKPSDTPPSCAVNHYQCSSGTSSNNSENSVQYTWSCGNSAGTTVNCAESKPPVINGMCSSPKVHYNCAVGSSTNTGQTSSQWTWSCAGSNGGSTASCTQNKTTTVVTVVPPSISPNDTITITWNGGGECTSTNFTIDGANSGSKTLNPTVTTTYTLTCNDESASATVRVQKKPIIIED
ncbi:MAG: thrombospondin type-1 domain-containing protein [Candidatus Pacebacteria bacterium]|nr:thrombospondin type-1 domain-containing protein [Candidatus Paceibacterota bacterium]